MSLLFLVVSLLSSTVPGTDKVLSIHCCESPSVKTQLGWVQGSLKTICGNHAKARDEMKQEAHWSWSKWGQQFWSHCRGISKNWEIEKDSAIQTFPRASSETLLLGCARIEVCIWREEVLKCAAWSKNSSRGLPFYRKMIIASISLLERGQAAWCTYMTLLLRPVWYLSSAKNFYRLGTLNGGLLHSDSSEGYSSQFSEAVRWCPFCIILAPVASGYLWL